MKGVESLHAQIWTSEIGHYISTMPAVVDIDHKGVSDSKRHAEFAGGRWEGHPPESRPGRPKQNQARMQMRHRSGPAHEKALGRERGQRAKVTGRIHQPKNQEQRPT